MSTERKIYIDYLRVFCCLGVIMIHILTDAKVIFSDSKILASLTIVASNCMHFAVPIFFMITGYLFLTNDKSANLALYVKKYVLKYVYAIFIFGYCYAVIELIFNKKFTFNLPIIALINTIKGDTWTHMWYLYTLVGVMLFIPLLNIIKNTNKKYLDYVFMITFINSFIFPLINNLFNVKIAIDLIIFSPYLVYVMLGYYIGNFYNYNRKLVIAILFVSLLGINFLEFFNFLSFDCNFFAKYNSLFVLIYSCCIFVLFSKISSKKNIIIKISNETYGIYLIHMVFVYFIYRVLKINPYKITILIPLNFLLVFLITFSFSYLFTKIMKKIPKLKNIL